jgi:hypothetical protein
MTRTSIAALAAALLGAACDDKGPAPVAMGPQAAPNPAPPAASQSASATAKTSAEPTGAASSSASAAAPGKTFDCGGKQQKPCPMQGWMKTVMAPASSGDDPKKLEQALDYVAKHAPPGYDKWTSIANGGMAKAKAGDIDGAKASCKECHDLYKDDYKRTMRDRPF